jgi:hypothetical protein
MTKHAGFQVKTRQINDVQLCNLEWIDQVSYSAKLLDTLQLEVISLC